VADADEMVSVLAAPELYAFIGGEPPTLADVRARYERLAVGGSADGSQEWVNWIARRVEDGAAVGTVQATVLDAGTADAGGAEPGRVADVAWVVGAAFQGRGYDVFVAHDLDEENVALLRDRKISAVLHHDLRVDLRRACHAILQANRVLPGPVRTNPSAIQVITPHNAPPVEF